jgi:hypothetical protein
MDSRIKSGHDEWCSVKSRKAPQRLVGATLRANVGTSSGTMDGDMRARLGL